jgi:hypothetical protein
VSAGLLARFIWASASAFSAMAFAPPDGEAETPPPSDAPPSDVPPSDATPSAPPQGEQPEELPRDERYDPILPYGEAQAPPEIEYAEETPPPPELEYAEETPPPPELEYDQTRQREPPADEALAREADQADDLGKDKFRGRQESPQRFAIEVKFGPYLPDIDRRWTGSGLGPYATIYGKIEDEDVGIATEPPNKRLFSVFGFEWQFYHAGGPLSLGVTVGVFGDTADALIADGVDANGSVRSAADKTRFRIVPLTLLLGYRFELLADRFRVPLVPYARGGLGYGFWWEKKGSSLAVNDAGQKARGGSFGWQVNLGMMLRLDFIERATAVDLDRLTGINHTYVFGEWQFSHLDGFGTGKAMSVGDDTFTVGLAFEF